MDTPVASEWQKQGIAAKAPRKEDMAPAPILFARNVFLRDLLKTSLRPLGAQGKEARSLTAIPCRMHRISFDLRS